MEKNEKAITIVDDNNNVIGSATRVDAVKKGLWHRIVVILVFNSKGELFIHKRTADAPSCPNMWDHSVAGHVDAGEEPEQAAKRELLEEQGIEAESLTFVSIYKIEEDKELNRFYYLYTYKYDGEMHFQKEEVVAGKFISIDWLQEELKSNSEIYTDGLRKSLEVYLLNRNQI